MCVGVCVFFPPPFEDLLSSLSMGLGWPWNTHPPLGICPEAVQPAPDELGAELATIRQFTPSPAPGLTAQDLSETSTLGCWILPSWTFFASPLALFLLHKSHHKVHFSCPTPIHPQPLIGPHIGSSLSSSTNLTPSAPGC